MSESHLRFMARTRPPGLDKDAVNWALAEIERLRTPMTPEPIMTDVSNEEIEAAARAIWNHYYGTPEIFDHCLARGDGDTAETKFMFDKSMAGARAALTAAAQVREGAWSQPQVMPSSFHRLDANTAANSQGCVRGGRIYSP